MAGNRLLDREVIAIETLQLITVWQKPRFSDEGPQVIEGERRTFHLGHVAEIVDVVDIDLRGVNRADRRRDHCIDVDTRARKSK